ncbi:MAG: hypothetical protein KME12_00495 [Trichocoleus desertorum ATA4-8-CV12]|jgi:transcriptional regulator of aromatic amino acid metabolism|nr:hypothetical protein [Trichocoleus desertorum ATA4-8-CV12]
MRADLQGLEITKGELRRLSGVRRGDLLIPPTRRQISWELLRTLIAIALLALSYWVLSLNFAHHTFLLIVLHLSAVVGLVVDDVQTIHFSRKNRHLINLVMDVDRYNAVIKAIDINDQIEAAGNSEVALHNREQVIEALELTRSDLVRALKTERILRTNHRFMARHSDLFDNNLTALATLQVNDQASEHGRLLNQALDIAVDVQAEMKKLQNQRFS